MAAPIVYSLSIWRKATHATSGGVNVEIDKMSKKWAVFRLEREQWRALNWVQPDLSPFEAS
jgi:hypothetical protein